MSPQSTPAPRLLQQCDELLADIAVLQSEVTTINAPAIAAFKRAEELAAQAQEETAHHMELIKQKRQALAEIMKRNRKSLRRRALATKAGRIIELPHGSLMMKLAPKSVELPADTDDLVQTLLHTRGGKNFLEIKYTPNRKALQAASRRMQRLLGIRVGRYELYYAQAEGEDKRVEIGRRRYPEVGR